MKSSSLGLTRRENFSLMAAYGKESPCFCFYFLVDPGESQELTGDWQLSLRRGVCEAASHTKFSALLLGGIGEGGCISGAVCIDSEFIISPEGQNGFWL